MAQDYRFTLPQILCSVDLQFEEVCTATEQSQETIFKYISRHIVTGHNAGKSDVISLKCYKI